jgi:hypothetical protein
MQAGCSLLISHNFSYKVTLFVGGYFDTCKIQIPLDRLMIGTFVGDISI